MTKGATGDGDIAKLNEHVKIEIYPHLEIHSLPYKLEGSYSLYSLSDPDLIRLY